MDDASPISAANPEIETYKETNEVYLSMQPIDKAQDHSRFGFDDTFEHDLAASVANGMAVALSSISVALCGTTVARMIILTTPQKT